MTAPFQLSALQELGPADRVAFQRFGCGPALEPPFGRIHHAIQAHAAERPHATAMEHLGACMTYGELDRRADQLAGMLGEVGVRAGDRVGLFLTRSMPMVVGILAILKAGAAYVPQDVRITPAGHLQHIVRVAGIEVVLTTSEHAAALPAGIAKIVEIDRMAGGTRVEPVDSGNGDTAMVIFTSGTTGQPNGVQVTHANLCNVLLTAPGSLGIAPGTRVAQLLNIAFDMAAWEILGTLANGGTLVIRGRDIEQAARLADVIIATPSVLSGLNPDACANVRTVAVAGERCPRSLAEKWSRRAAFHNSCGPTEVTIVNTVQRYEHATGMLTIGRPVPNTTVYVLDEALRPCPIGQIGEMWAGGACVTAGYVGNDALTAERYRPDPFLGGDHKMFRTRDLARWTPDGQLEYHGRTDDQVKVRGFRVELDAVTSALEKSAGCVRAFTVLHEGRLVGFVSPRTASPELARLAVEQRLPYYCVPTLIVPMDRMPMTDRGKVDRCALLSCMDEPAQLETVA
ncbi:amino acid adenylation domain-containing protein [Kibdelosporangium banguiense]|uniref:Amino acid adenylation domain-containing protein n=1 Tax=Kibdelosporangium banguiense TaxID=1365924 RepID=A0ABS4TNU0_9PSEU|nr:amino acid adenylation domain-containing protein [Kibdelosporangium banguiense]MBP2326074.1 amino acid adenylation domain-containing protein [Kibdelosporangium banguiense]